MVETRQVAQFSIPFRSYLGRDGQELATLPASWSDPDGLAALYRGMVFARAFDQQAIQLQRTGKLGTYASSLGQEAVGVGVAAAMREDDVLVPSFREHGALLWRGVSPVELFLYWGGDERGSNYEACRQDFPISVPVGSQFPHGAGVALALSMDGNSQASVTLGGDGSTSKGDFYEALNICGAWRLPAVFVIANNCWAISTSHVVQTAAETLAQKAIAAGLPGEQVDGNDVIAVADAVDRALSRARDGGGATLIEALTYRLSDHTTADDARRYRDEAEVTERWALEPLRRMRSWLVAREAWNTEQEEALLHDCADRVEKAVNDYLAIPPQAPEAMFDHLFAELPMPLHSQRVRLGRRGQSDG
ncbi:MAG: pyruvate dehydrogenase (acetyl-transferring) E1 component subunit alpha [Alphaproteobacteria bacterium]|nr:pyruvate dehydrogenase (acetyl-transferring) E1 component subunit alpha [Alphaproteobacteria bacterium]